MVRQTWPDSAVKCWSGFFRIDPFVLAMQRRVRFFRSTIQAGRLNRSSSATVFVHAESLRHPRHPTESCVQLMANPYSPPTSTASHISEGETTDSPRRRANRIRYVLNSILLFPIAWAGLTLFITWAHLKGGDELNSAPVLTLSERWDRSLVPGTVLVVCFATMAGMLWWLPDEDLRD